MVRGVCFNAMMRTGIFLSYAGGFREAAEQEGFDPDLGEALWRRLIEWSIEREEGQLSKLDSRGGVPGS